MYVHCTYNVYCTLYIVQKEGALKKEKLLCLKGGKKNKIIVK